VTQRVTQIFFPSPPSATIGISGAVSAKRCGGGDANHAVVTHRKTSVTAPSSIFVENVMKQFIRFF
jgi:hypothetical protein